MNLDPHTRALADILVAVVVRELRAEIESDVRLLIDKCYDEGLVEAMDATSEHT